MSRTLRPRPKRKRKRPQALAPDFVVTLDVFEDEIGVFRDFDRMNEWADARGLGNARKYNAQNTNACAVQDNDRDGVAWFFAYIPRGCPPETVCHECLHLAWYVLKNAGVPVTFASQEVLAHVMQCLAGQILKR